MFFVHRANSVDQCLMLRVAAMRKIHTCDVHSVGDHLSKDALIGAGGAQRANNFCISRHNKRSGLMSFGKTQV